MQSDCEIYVDPEEDEVFFGCVSEREKTVYAKLADCAGSGVKDDRDELREVLDGCNTLNVNEEKVENSSKKEQTGRILEEITLDDTIDSTEPPQPNEKESTKVHSSNNTSVELEHNYSTPMKHKIDKSILTTPKSVVKADKDGGFLKVLSEIALVKAEAEGDKEDDKREDEDKENKVIPAVPEIRITEASPEKVSVKYSPPKSVSSELRRFRIIYSSPQKEENECKKSSHAESLESEKNYINKCMMDKVVGKEKRKSIQLIDFSDCTGEGEKEAREEKKGAEAEEEEKKKPPGMRFSKEARKIVEVLKKSAVDDTLNFTIPEIDVEEEENSFLSPEPVTAFDETVILNGGETSERKPAPAAAVASPRVLARPADNKLAAKSKSVEKERRREVRVTPSASQGKLQPMKYFSERRIYNKCGSETKVKCVKKLPLEETVVTSTTVERKVNGGRGGQSVSTSRIPVFGLSNSKIPTAERTVKGVVKNTPSKTPTGKVHRNPKFNHIESPINAYINNKPTSLVLNVKPEAKKDGLAKVWKGSERKIQEKPSSRLQGPPASSAVKLPFVEYKSATPYKIEKRPESRLPRLAPNVMKLIGTHSPKVLKHEGRFYVNTPRKQSSTENTIIAEPNEVSVVVSQPVQKSNTIK